MAQSKSRTLGHWRIGVDVNIFDIWSEAEPGTLHCHLTYNFGCVLGGRGRMDIGEHQIMHPKGSVILLNPLDAHASTWLDAENRYFVVTIGKKGWRELTELIGADESTRLDQPVVRDSILYYALKGLWSELRSAPESIGLEDIANLVRVCISRGMTTGGDTTHFGEPQSKAILQSLAPRSPSDGSDASRRVEDVAADLGMSRFELSRLCLESHGMQPRRLKLQLMVARAQSEISNGASLTEAALHAGFSDQSHMSREFRKTIGMTPREFQNVIDPVTHN